MTTIKETGKIKITEVSETPISPKIIHSIRNIIEKEGYLECNAVIKAIKPNDGILMSVFYEADLIGNTANGELIINLFIKLILPDQHLTIYNSADSFVKEEYVYRELFSILSQVQDEAKVPPGERFIVPKGYDETTDEYIIMENLTKKGFTTIDRREVVTYEFAKLSMQLLAKFHALSFVLREKRPNYFNEKIVKLKQPFYYGTEAWNGFVDCVSRLSASCLENNAKERVLKYIPTTFEKYAKYTMDPNMARCIVHNDFRPANVMLKLENDKIKQVMPIDFQLVFYGCPIIDFLYYVFTTTDQEFRSNHLETLKDIYHETMTDFLKYFDIDVNKYLSRTDFEKMYKEKLDYGLMISLWYLSTVLADEGEIGDVTNMDLSQMTFKFNNLSKTRIGGVVEDFIHWGYI